MRSAAQFLLVSLVFVSAQAGVSDEARVAVPVAKSGSVAQVCPISDTGALTARHVTRANSDGSEEDLAKPAQPIIFESNGRGPGVAEEVYADTRRDISVIKAVIGTFPFHYALAASPPSVGETVTLVGYTPSFTPEVMRAKVVWIFAGVVYFDHSPGPGSSGSCLLSTTSPPVVYAINSLYFDRTGGKTGAALAVWGEWGVIPEQYRSTTAPK
jgi:hypothetical protein